MENLFSLAGTCLSESNLDKKIELSTRYAEKIVSGNIQIRSLMDATTSAIIVGRPGKPVLISPKDLPRRNIKTTEGRAAMIHSFAHIEFNAINLAWDLIYRFQEMPDDFYSDWASVAAEETKHFVLLRKKLQKMDYDYGDFPAHDGLWKIAEDTAHDILLRLAVVPRIMEARGLDVTPDLINRFREINDNETASILDVILVEEIGHVSIGTKWYRHVCKKREKDPEITFRKIIDEYLPSNKTKKINQSARLMAGFSQSELDYIVSI